MHTHRRAASCSWLLAKTRRARWRRRWRGPRPRSARPPTCSSTQTRRCWWTMLLAQVGGWAGRAGGHSTMHDACRACRGNLCAAACCSALASQQPCFRCPTNACRRPDALALPLGAGADPVGRHPGQESGLLAGAEGTRRPTRATQNAHAPLERQQPLLRSCADPTSLVSWRPTPLPSHHPASTAGQAAAEADGRRL